MCKNNSRAALPDQTWITQGVAKLFSMFSDQGSVRRKPLLSFDKAVSSAKLASTYSDCFCSSFHRTTWYTSAWKHSARVRLFSAFVPTDERRMSPSADSVTRPDGRPALQWLVLVFLPSISGYPFASRCWYDLSCPSQSSTVQRRCQFRILETDSAQSSASNPLIVNCSATADQFKTFPPVNPGDLGFHLLPNAAPSDSCSRRAMLLQATNITSSKRYLIGCFCSYSGTDPELEQCVHSIQATQGSPSSQCPQRSRMVVIPCSYEQKVTDDVVAFTSAKQRTASSPKPQTSTASSPKPQTSTASSPKPQTSVSATADMRTPLASDFPTAAENNNPPSVSRISRCHLQTDCFSADTTPKRSCNFWLKTYKSSSGPAETDRYVINSSSVNTDFKELPVLTQAENGFHLDQQNAQNCAKHIVWLRSFNSTGMVYQLACFCRYEADINHLPRLQQCAFNIKTGNDSSICPQAYRTLVLPSEVEPTTESTSPSQTAVLSTSLHSTLKTTNNTAIATGKKQDMIIAGITGGLVSVAVLIIIAGVVYKCVRATPVNTSTSTLGSHNQPGPVPGDNIAVDSNPDSVAVQPEEPIPSDETFTSLNLEAAKQDHLPQVTPFNTLKQIMPVLIRQLSLDDLEILLAEGIIDTGEYEEVQANKDRSGRTAAVRKLMSILLRKSDQQIRGFFVHITLPEEEKAKLFGPFWCGESTSSRPPDRWDRTVNEWVHAGNGDGYGETMGNGLAEQTLEDRSGDGGTLYNHGPASHGPTGTDLQHSTLDEKVESAV